jgi:uncharacterized membrane protein YdjX (TVP38/TMEM64 family)
MQTIEDIPRSHFPAQRIGGAKVLRIAAVMILLILVLLVLAALLLTQRGQILLHNPRLLRDEVNAFVGDHRFSAPMLYIAVYVILGVLALPVWWMQILGGMAFGLPIAVIYTQAAATTGAVTAAWFSHWLAADWFHRLESQLDRLRSLDETFGRNGLLVVMAVRLSHVLPFGLSNYAFGLTTMRTRDIAWGSLLGGLPAACTYVAMGTGGRPLSDWRYIVGIVVLNAVLIIPLIVHYLMKRE